MPAVQALLKQTWVETYAPIYGDEEASRLSAEWHSIDALSAQLERPKSEFILADSGTELGGMAYASRMGDNRVKIHQLYVAGFHKGAGIGSQLLEEVFDSFFDAQQFELEVATANQQAIIFYQAKGFTKTGETANCGTDDSGLAAFEMIYQR